MPSNFRLVALTGFKQVGKTEVARYMERRWGFRIMPFSAPAVAMLKVFGLDDAAFSPQRQHCKLEGLGTPADLLEKLVELWGRSGVSKELWVDRWKEAVDATTRGNRINLIVVDDLVHDNEREAVRGLGGALWRVRHPKRGPRSVREEETIEAHEEDRTLSNHSGLKELYRAVDALVLDQKR